MLKFTKEMFVFIMAIVLFLLWCILRPLGLSRFIVGLQRKLLAFDRELKFKAKKR